MKQGHYNRRVEALKKAKAEWQAKQAALADDHPHKGASDHGAAEPGVPISRAKSPCRLIYRPRRLDQQARRDGDVVLIPIKRYFRGKLLERSGLANDNTSLAVMVDSRTEGLSIPACLSQTFDVPLLCRRA